MNLSGIQPEQGCAHRLFVASIWCPAGYDAATDSTRNAFTATVAL